MQSILVPASYDVWLTDLKHHLDRHPGSKAELARFLVHTKGIKFKGAQVRVSQLLSRQHIPSAETFLDIAAWLQEKTDAQD